MAARAVTAPQPMAEAATASGDTVLVLDMTTRATGIGIDNEAAPPGVMALAVAVSTAATGEDERPRLRPRPMLPLLEPTENMRPAS
mmetsp:Transcript_52321/g.168550  ORF Transcript_52321/g.168550 Transcript_52321/m.168550 type:complete len:86 (+) Transcript_52321:564-821(+)